MYLILLEHTLGGLLFMFVFQCAHTNNRQFAMSFKTKLEPDQRSIIVCLLIRRVLKMYLKTLLGPSGIIEFKGN